MNQSVKSFSSFFDTFWAPNDEEETDKQEIIDFYADFLDYNDKMKAEIISHEILEGNGKKYTVYIIKVITSFLEYKINKRFSLFSSLYQQLAKKYKNLNLHEINFPSKQFFRSLDIETIERRKILLNDFLTVLCQKYKDYNIVEFMEFLDVRKMYLKALTNPNSLPFTDKPLRTSQETEQVLKFITNLNKNPENLISTFNDFDKFYFGTKPKINLDVVKTILTGDYRNKDKNKNIRGLIFFCGKFDEAQDSHIVCSVGLPLLAKLLSFETNADAEMFNNIYSKIHPNLLKQLKLDSHIVGKTQKNCKAYALRLVHIYLSRHPNENINEILENEEGIQEYEKWKFSQITTSIKAENYVVKTNCVLGYNKEEMKYKDDVKSERIEDYHQIDLNPKKIHEVFNDNQIEWVLYETKYQWLRMEYSSDVFLKISLMVDSGVDECLTYFSDDFSWLVNAVESRYLKTEEDKSARVTKYNYDHPPYKYMLVTIERKIEEDFENDTVRILERPYSTQGLMVNTEDAIGKRLMSITIRSVSFSPKEKKTKIKVLIKNINDVAKNYMNTDFRRAEPFILTSVRNLYAKLTSN